jgi:dephospho-CoA kinase
MIVGLTGGMGSGKTTILKMFQKLGAAIYIADSEAKQLMVNSETLRNKITEAFGKESYINNKLNRAYLSKTAFSDTEKLKLLNSFVHPEVHQHFKKFVSKSKAQYVIFESALLFKSKVLDLCTYKIVVTAPLSIRLERIMQRDSLSKAEIEQRLNYQNYSDEMVSKADFVIENLDLKVSEHQVLKFHKLILSSL